MCLADPSGNPRPNRMIRLLAANGYAVDVAGFPARDPQGIPVRRFLDLPVPSTALGARIARKAARANAAVAVSGFGAGAAAEGAMLRALGIGRSRPALRDYDLIVVENVELLPLAFEAQPRAKIVFDAREYLTRESEESWLYRRVDAPLNRYLLETYLHACDLAVTVSAGLASEYAREFGRQMLVIRSTPLYAELPVRPTAPDQIRCVHHGNANPDRRLDNLIEIIQGLDRRFQLDLYLVGSAKEKERLQRVAAGCERVHFREPVAFGGILPMLSQYDVGLYFLEPLGFNVTFSLPNKLFEFIQARLAVAVGPSPDMADVVTQFACGVVAPEFSVAAMRETMAVLDAPTIDRLKQHSDRAARALCWEEESKRFLAALRGIGL